MCLIIYHFDTTKFLSVLGLVCQADLKKTEVKLELLTDIDMLLMVDEGIEEEYAMQFIILQKLIINI